MLVTEVLDQVVSVSQDQDEVLEAGCDVQVPV